MDNALSLLLERLDAGSSAPRTRPYGVPALWATPTEPDTARVVEVDPWLFHRERIRAILAEPGRHPARLASAGEWTSRAVVYNLFVRLTTAWDHDGDGRIALDDGPEDFRETGTFLKSIALLPYLHRLGVTILHLLPVTAIGQDGNKGSLGSPYAIRNPYKLDERLAEPALGLGVDLEYKAFVEAAHHLGMRVVMEFVFRTAAKDADWIADHPNWFYWIDAEVPDRDGSPDSAQGYGSPHFPEEELRIISQRIKRNDLSSLPPPSLAYRSLFRDTPVAVHQDGTRYLGSLEDGSAARIPGAFADWPPDDVQPPWNDVTYLKLYEHPAFNYIAYNTIRMYDTRLAAVENENRGLWNTIINIIPHYQKNFAIDGVMIDMGHALPKRLKQSIVDRARRVDPDFAFWEENFAISARSRQEGYNAAVGYLWSDEHLPHKLREFLELLSRQDLPVPFFATPESHNTPRAAARPGGLLYSRQAAVINAFLPALWFLHQGYELGETWPVNTGLGFSPEELAALPSHRLPLFSESALCWTNPGEFTDLIALLAQIRRDWESIITDPRASTISLLPFSDSRILAFSRHDPEANHRLVVLANLDLTSPVSASGFLGVTESTVRDSLSDRDVPLDDGHLHRTFEPGETLVLELTELPPPLS